MHLQASSQGPPDSAVVYAAAGTLAQHRSSGAVVTVQRVRRRLPIFRLTYLLTYLKVKQLTQPYPSRRYEISCPQYACAHYSVPLISIRSAPCCIRSSRVSTVLIISLDVAICDSSQSQNESRRISNRVKIESRAFKSNLLVVKNRIVVSDSIAIWICPSLLADVQRERL